MSIRREHKPGDLDKRLKILNQQLYGKEKTLETRNSKLEIETRDLKLDHPDSSYKLPERSSSFKNPASDSDITYLRHDLIKITILAGLAFGVQLALYFGSIHKLIKLPF